MDAVLLDEWHAPAGMDKYFVEPVIRLSQSRVVSRQTHAFLCVIGLPENVGAGHPGSGARIPPAFQTQGWREIRLDIDPANAPDIPGTMLDCGGCGVCGCHIFFT